MMQCVLSFYIVLLLSFLQRAQMQEIEKNAEALQLRMPDLFKRSTETDYKKTMKKLGKY